MARDKSKLPTDICLAQAEHDERLRRHSGSVRNDDLPADETADRLGPDGLEPFDSNTGKSGSDDHPAAEHPVVSRTRQLLDAPKFRAGLQLMLDACEYARLVKRDVTEFAVEIAGLQAVGLNCSDLRWLACNRYVCQLEEETAVDDRKRKFRQSVNLAFCDRTCFVLTKKGELVAKHFAVSGTDNAEEIGLPCWDAELHELRFRGRLIKRYSRPSPNQELILNAFQEDGWPFRIDDPLPPAPDQDPKQRIRDAIKNLNRNQRYPLIRFHGDGTGQGIRWAVVSVRAPIRQP